MANSYNPDISTDSSPREIGVSQATSTRGSARYSFAEQADTEDFVRTLERFERGEMTADQWRAYRLVMGVYGQRQDDVQMFRVKVPQGVLTSEALSVLADACETWSRGFAHITTRQNIQMHFVRLDDSPACMERLASAGLTTREACGNSVRNIVACPLAGVCAQETFDVSPYAEALTRYFLRHPLSSSLPRKFKIAFGGCEPDCAQGAIHDIGFRARQRTVNGNLERGFMITIGGGTATLSQSGSVLYDFISAGEIFNVAEAVLRVFNKHGNRRSKANARMKYLIRKVGWEQWKKLYEEELRGVHAEGGASLPFDPQNPPPQETPERSLEQPPTVSEVASRVADAKLKGPGIVPQVEGSAPPPFSVAEFERFCRTNVRPQLQPGYVAVTVHVPMGDLTGPQFRVLADLATAYGDSAVRTTTRQNLLLQWVRREDTIELYRRLWAAGLGRADADTIADVASCPGAESCRLAVTQSRGLGRELTEFFESRPDMVALAGDSSIKISGCPNGCSQHHIATLGFQGSIRRLEDKSLVPQYQLLVGGGVGADGARFGRRSVKIPARRVTEAIERLLLWYKEHREPEERASAFFARADLGEIAKVLAGLIEIEVGNVRPEDYIDIGEDHAFNPEVMEGECAA